MNKKEKMKSLETYVDDVNARTTHNSITLNNLFLKVNTIIENYNHDVKYLNQYIGALKFLMWFDWDKLSSQKLINEAKNKLIEDLPMSDDYYSLAYVDKFETEPKDKVLGTINPEMNYNIYADYSPFIKVDKEPKHEYKDYVKAVVANPNNYDKETICKVVNYLKQVIETNKTLQKYNV